MKSIALISTILLLLSGITEVQKQQQSPEFWYEDNNMRRAGGYPPDFREMFAKPESWSTLRSLIDVYYLRGNTFQNLCTDLGEDFVRDHFVKVLNESQIPVAIDNLSSWERNIPLLRHFGAEIIALSLQSTLSKGLNQRTKDLELELDRKVQTVVSEVRAVHNAYPELRIGVIDALPTKGVEYRDVYRKMIDELASEGLELSYIHLDCPVDFPQQGLNIDWSGVKEVEEYVQNNLGIEFGFICTSNGGGMESDRLFHDNVLRIPESYPKHGGLPDHFIIMSWYPHPSLSIPEDAPEGKYPMTKTALKLATGLLNLTPVPEKHNP
jgi:hypothetical protein